MTVRTRTRRAIDVGEHPSGRDQIRLLAEQFYVANKAKNEASTEERRIQKELDKAMAKVGAGDAWGMEHDILLSSDGTTKRVAIRYDGALKEVMDVGKLVTQVPMDVLLKIVIASRAAVEKHAGKNVVNLCVVTTQSAFKATVKEVK